MAMGVCALLALRVGLQDGGASSLAQAAFLGGASFLLAWVGHVRGAQLGRDVARAPSVRLIGFAGLVAVIAAVGVGWELLRAMLA